LNNLRDTLYTYASPRPFGQFSMPVPAQNSCMREYANLGGFLYRLPTLELMYENCFAQLFRVIHELPQGANFCCYSVLMLPLYSNAKLSSFIDLAKSKNIIFHSVFERLKTDTYSEIYEQTQVNLLSNLIRDESSDGQKEILVSLKVVG